MLFLQEVVLLDSGCRPQADVPLPLGEVSLQSDDGEGLVLVFIYVEGSIAASRVGRGWRLRQPDLLGLAVIFTFA